MAQVMTIAIDDDAYDSLVKMAEKFRVTEEEMAASLLTGDIRIKMSEARNPRKRTGAVIKHDRTENGVLILSDMDESDWEW